MDAIQYVGERLWAGELGRGLIYLSFTTALVACLAYAVGSREHWPQHRESLLRLGRGAFWIHGFSLLSSIALLLYIMVNKYFEYEYVWAHTSNELPFRYIFSAFWEGQEGSFMLWGFWNVILGFLLIKTAKTWEMPVMATFSVMQLALTSMLLGFYFGEADGRIGSNPFVLLRDQHFSPRFNEANYLTGLEGTGLNPLLQNWWMTIHPPTLFLGFASTMVPFAYAIAGLWRGEHKAWITAALPWALFSGAILGAGILMGGAWAYEALSFGGYWAWDPVENASLVPWLTLVAGIHTALVAKNTDHSIRSTYFFFLITFVLIVYSTFLTRSGILGETSAHAFTEMGLEWQLVLFLGLSFLWGFIPFLYQYRHIASPKEEESAYAKEFWLFVGALVLLFSGVLITATTSIPVFNALVQGLGWENQIPKIAPPEDVVAHHNRFQLWIGVLIGLLSGLAQFFRYRQTTAQGSYAQTLRKHLIFSTVAASVLVVPVMYPSGIQAWQYWVLVWAGLFAIVSNADYLIRVLRWKTKLAGSVLSHLGFGLLVIGAVFAGALKEPLSEGFTSVDDALQGLSKQSNKNILVVKGSNTPMKDGYEVSYQDTWEEGNAQIFALNFRRRDAQGQILDSFTTYPNVLRQILPSGQRKFEAANPNTKHYLSHDVFTLAVPSWAFENPEEERKKQDSLNQAWKVHKIQIGDTVFTSKGFLRLDNIEKNPPPHPQYQAEAGDIAIALQIQWHQFISEDSVRVRSLSPIYYIRDNQQFDVPEILQGENLSLRFSRIFPQDNSFEIRVLEHAPEKEYLVVQVLRFPWINLVWLGTSLMTIGLSLAMLLRIREKHLAEQLEKQTQTS